MRYITDDNVLRLNGGMALALSTPLTFLPDQAYDLFWTDKVPKSNTIIRWFGICGFFLGAQLLAPTFGGNEKSKKNTLKTVGVSWAIASARNFTLLHSKHEKKINYVRAVGGLAIGGLSLYQGLKKGPTLSAPTITTATAVKK